nr:aspartate kinase [Bacilli bacterium]
MKIGVQKFGGTSVSSREMRERAIAHIEKALEDPNMHIVVVVSAMGRIGEPYATDTLLSLIPDSDTASMRDRDLLMSCGETISAVVFGSMLRSYGHDVAVLTGFQAGIKTTQDFGNARIETIDPTRILAELKAKRVVVVTGFQGAAAEHEITTLGRGGSDTTATALGVALDAMWIDIFTDVDGIMTADPRIVDSVSKLDRVTYNEICNLAYAGAKVIHPRAVELAMQKNIPIRVRSTMSDDEGTLVTNETPMLESRMTNDRILTGVTHTTNITQLKVTSPTGKKGFQAEVFQTVAKAGISVDFFNVTPHEVAFTVPKGRAKEAVSLLMAKEMDVHTVSEVAKVSAIGAGIHGVPGVMARIVQILTLAEIEILQSADSNTTIWCLVHEHDAIAAVRAIHDHFDLSLRGGDR